MVEQKNIIYNIYKKISIKNVNVKVEKAKKSDDILPIDTMTDSSQQIPT